MLLFNNNLTFKIVLIGSEIICITSDNGNRLAFITLVNKLKPGLKPLTQTLENLVPKKSGSWKILDLKNLENISRRTDERKKIIRRPYSIILSTLKKKKML